MKNRVANRMVLILKACRHIIKSGNQPTLSGVADQIGMKKASASAYFSWLCQGKMLERHAKGKIGAAATFTITELGNAVADGKFQLSYSHRKLVANKTTHPAIISVPETETTHKDGFVEWDTATIQPIPENPPPAPVPQEKPINQSGLRQLTEFEKMTGRRQRL